MIKLKKISMSNFMSFGKKETVVDLDQGKHVLIQGNNLDVGQEGESRNGVGKTAFMNAVVFSLYGKGIDKLKPDQFVNIINKKKMMVELDFDIGDDSFKIRRGRKPSFVELYKNGNPLTRDSMKNTDEEIQSILGIPYEVFMSIYFLSPHKESFMGMTSAEQRNYLESVLSLDVLVNRSETLKSIKKDLAMDIKLIDKDYQNALSQKEKATSNVSRLESSVRRFEDNRMHCITSMEKALEEASQIDFDGNINKLESLPSLDDISKSQMELKGLEQRRNMIQYQIDSMEKRIKSLEVLESKANSFFDELEGKKKKLQEELESYPSRDDILTSIDYKEKLDKKREEYKALKKELDFKKKERDSLASAMEEKLDESESLQSGSCPYCNQSHFDQTKVDEIESFLSEKEKEFDKIESEIGSYIRTLSGIEEDGYELLEKIDESCNYNEILKKVDFLYEKIEEVDSRMREENPYEEQIEEMKREIEETDCHKLRDDIREIDKEIEIRVDRLNTMEDTVESTLKEVKDSTGTSSVEELRSMKKEVKSIENDIQEEREKINPYEEELDIAKKSIPDDSKIKEEMDELKKDEEHVSYLIKLLTDPKSFVRKNIVDQYIPYVNKKINEYSESLGLMHVVEILPDMTVDIQYMRREVSYYNMSQGERLRLNLATAVAFGDLMGMLGKNVNFKMVDEYLDSALDTEGMYKAFNFLKSKSDNIMMVSHRDELSKEVDETVVVTKKDGFSRLD